MTPDSAPPVMRRHLLQLARVQCDHAKELDCRREYQHRIDDLKMRLEKLEATPISPGTDSKSTR
jgi:hypothetical protein